ncbi:flagellar hook-associated protein 1 FlgK [Modicisalibacter ilicicola DSM 19980]|uniref:Flagellar hook-associated protein 1 n=1 Tax=Modicisalibacter ilicicola DSM 19980 TaxID=1121942 RepID=A0A1M4YZV9_9GAMM|nr:flagellar hook-associated protein FlgK [Halomonas ilicicola]SHF11344.1 flagellar hook-associated protein 1 FlgK [Halomonas ilicicola DSM 19980]
MSLFSIGLSGLSAAQTALQTTGSNISNVYTPGYNRQLTLLGESSTGGGVQVNDVQRQFNTYVASQLNEAKGSSSALQAYSTQISQIDNLLADREAGLAPLMQNFFSSLEDLASAPSDPAARQGVLGTAETLTAQFRSFDSYLDDMQSGINGKIRDEVTQINNSADQVAKLNREIILAKAKTGEAPNSLLDQRDKMVAELGQRVGVKLTVQDGGSYNLTIGNGQPLVAGNRSFPLEAVGSAVDPSRTVVAYRDASNNVIELAESTFDKGTLGGLMTFRSESLDKTQNQLGQMALNLATEFNAQHAKGLDLNGDPGKAFFSIPSAKVIPNAGNDGSGVTVEVAFVDSAKVSTSDYDIRYEGPGAADFVITRKDSGSQVNATAGTDANGDPTLAFDGVELTVTGSPVPGDRFELQPTRDLAGGVDVEITDGAEIAAAEDTDPSSATDPVSKGDNRNALELQALQSRNIVGGNASLNEAYASIVSDVGNRTNVVKANLSAQEGLTEQLTAVQQSESGVNLDEEAANLLRFQQYYQANAKVIDIGTRVLDAVLGLR